MQRRRSAVFNRVSGEQHQTGPGLHLCCGLEPQAGLKPGTLAIVCFQVVCLHPVCVDTRGFGAVLVTTVTRLAGGAAARAGADVSVFVKGGHD